MIHPGHLWQAQLSAAKQFVHDLEQDTQLQASFLQWVSLSLQALQQGRKLLFVGNGGSAADAQHMAAELVVRFKLNRRGLPALALTVDTSALTAIGNDYGFDELFARQLEALGQSGDVLVAMSTSGQSANVVRAAEQAKAMGIHVVSLTGAQGGRLAQLADLHLPMPSTDTPRIQEGHTLLGHMLCDLLEQYCAAGQI